jgi:PAS domain S-box-containing protein
MIMDKKDINMLPLHSDSEVKSSFSPKMEDMELDMHTEQNTTLRTYAHLMLEHVPVGMALFDARDLRLLAANTRYHSFLEPTWQHGHAIGRPLTEVLPQTERSEIAAIFRRVAETGDVYRAEEYATSVPGRGVTYWNWTLEPISENGQIGYVLLTMTEATSQTVARKSSEQAQTALAQTYRAVELERQRLEYTEAILLSVQNVSEPKVLAQAVLSALDACFSPRLLALYSTSAEQGTLSLVASHTHASRHHKASVFPPFLSSPSGSSALQAMHQRTPTIKRKSREMSKDGCKERDALLSLPGIECVMYLPLWEKRCEGVLVAAFAREEEADDLLVRTLSECAPHLAEALASARLHATITDERQRLHTILDQLPEGVLLVEALTSKVEYANPAAAQLLGFTLPQLIGVPLNQSALLSPYGLASQNQQSAFRWKFALIHALWGKTTRGLELSITRPDGSEIVVLSSAAPIRRSNGLTSGAVIVFQDITALKQLEQQKSMFFAVVNHELRTPLTTIMGFADLLQFSAPDGADSRYQYAVTNIVHECEHLTQLIDELLDVSRLEHAQLDLQRSYQDLLGPLKQLVTKYTHTTRTHHLRLTLEDLESSDVLMGWFDLPRIEQVLSNLITNAIKYSPVGSEIEVGVRPYPDAQSTAQEVLIRVKDQGIGIAADDLPHIFQRFYRASTLDRSISGFGIGLYLTKELVQGHGGRIWVETTKGQGSTFFVALPLGETTSARLYPRSNPA